MKPKVSIIIPNYNHEAYLKKRIDSVLTQTYQNFEVIILDDCSTDRSYEIIEGYRQHPIVSTINYNKQNSGSAFKQWKKGIELAKGEWIWIAESDDFCTHDMLSRLIDNIGRCADVVLSYCQSFEVDENGNIKRDMSFHTDTIDTGHWKIDYCINGEEEIRKYLLYINSIPNASGVIFRKSAYERADKSFGHMNLCGDWLLWIQLLKQGNVAYCATPLNRFREHTTTTRVLDTAAKIQKRLEEEYQVVMNIKDTVRFENDLLVKDRLDKLYLRYSNNYTNGQILKVLMNPFIYHKKIPLFKLLTAYIKNKFRHL